MKDDQRKRLPDRTILVDRKGDKYQIVKSMGEGNSGFVYGVTSSQRNGEKRYFDFCIKEPYPKDTGFYRGDDMFVHCNDHETELIRARQSEYELKIGAKCGTGNRHILPLNEKLDIAEIWIDGNKYTTSDAGSTCYYLLLSYEGRCTNLKDIVSEGTYPLKFYIALFYEVLRAAESIQSLDVVHGDLSLNNIQFFDCRPEEGICGTAILTDFGNARILSDPNVDTVLHTVPISSGFAAPEVVSGATVTKASDIFSLGAVMYAILNKGIVPEICDMTSKYRLNPLQSKAIQANKYRLKINEILEKATDGCPENRYHSVASFQNDVKQLYEIIANPRIIAPVPQLTQTLLKSNGREKQLADMNSLLENSAKGFCCGIMAQSGAGKSVFLHLLGHLYTQRHPKANVVFLTYDYKYRFDGMVARICIDADDDTWNEDTTSEIRHAEYLNRLKLLKRLTSDDLILIDNLNADEFSTFSDLIKADCFINDMFNLEAKVVYTTTYRLTSSEYYFELKPLSDEYLLGLFRSKSNRATWMIHKDILLAGFEMVDRNTYVLTLFAHVLEEYGNISNIYNLVDALFCKGDWDRGVLSKKDLSVSGDVNLNEAIGRTVLCGNTTPVDIEVLVHVARTGKEGVPCSLLDSVELSYGKAHVEALKRQIRLGRILSDGIYYRVHNLMSNYIMHNYELQYPTSIGEHGTDKKLHKVAGMSLLLGFLKRKSDKNNKENKIIVLSSGKKYLILKQAIYMNDNYFIADQVSDDETELMSKFVVLHETEYNGKTFVEEVTHPGILETVLKKIKM